MNPKRFAFIAGVVMLALGICSLIFKGSADSLPALTVETSYGLFLGLIPMNIFNKIALIIFGLGGIRAANDKFASLPLSIFYSRVVFFMMGLLAILGLFPRTNTLFGYWPLFGNDVVAHAFFAALGAYFGYALKTKLHKKPERDYTMPIHGL